VNLALILFPATVRIAFIPGAGLAPIHAWRAGGFLRFFSTMRGILQGAA
jgi:hypothetical protein